MGITKNKINPVIFGLNGYYLNQNEIKMIKDNSIYGFIFFKRNIKNLYQFKSLINHIRYLSSNNPILMIDHEGGRINRFNSIFSQTKYTGEYFGKLYKRNKKLFYIESKNFVKTNVNLFKYLGINTVAYPVCDLRRSNTHDVIGDRSFSEDISIVKKLSSHFIHEYQLRGISCISKHVPGHGLSMQDSHFVLPVVTKDKIYLMKNDFLCFKGVKSKYMMTAHILYNSLDNMIASYSQKIISLARNKFNFKGLIMTDDICMKALNERLEHKVTQPLIAGCDIILHCSGNNNEMNKIISILSKWMNLKPIKKH